MTPTRHTGQDCRDTLIPVTGKGTSRHTIRAEDALWDEFDAAAKLLDSDRSTLLRDYMAWVLRKPDARPPRQVPASKASNDG